MNVTEQQKYYIIRFMQQHPDFGRGRLRYNNENKRKIDKLWEKLSVSLNSLAYGPHKSAKEWAKTWRDWKSNTLKKVAKHKNYMMGTGGGSPKHFQLSATESTLLDFLTSDASGLTGIPECGFTDIMTKCDNEILSSSTLSHSIEKTESLEETFTSDISNDAMIHLESYEIQSPSEQNKQQMQQSESLSLFNTNIQNMQIKRKKHAIQPTTKINKYNETFDMQNIHENKENLEEDNKTRCTSSFNDTEKNIAKYSAGVKKPQLMATAINLLEKKSSSSENIKQQILELKKKEFELKKVEVTIFKDILQQLQNAVDLISSLREELVGQYLTTDV